MSMFSDLLSLTSGQMKTFSATVQDSFGQSIVSDFFDPLSSNIVTLQEMSDELQHSFERIDETIMELESGL